MINEEDILTSPEFKDVLQTLNSEGYKRVHIPSDGINGIKTFSKDIQSVDFLCTTNNKLFIEVTLHSLKLPDIEVNSVEMKINHSNSEEDWYSISVYGLSPEDFVARYYDYKHGLLEAWRALY